MKFVISKQTKNCPYCLYCLCPHAGKRKKKRVFIVLKNTQERKVKKKNAY